MFRTAPNFSNIRNRVPAHISRHQTFDIVAGFVGKDKQKKKKKEKEIIMWKNPRIPYGTCTEA